MIAYLRTIIFYLVCVPSTLSLAAFFGVFAYLIPYPARYHIVIGGWAKMMHFFTVYILGIKVRVHGRENIPNEACVIISNHQSAWETYYLQHLFKPQSQVAKASLLNIPFFGWTFRMLKPIAIDRSNKRQSMQQVIVKGSERIKEGCSVLIFPEGTRSKPSNPLPFRKGGAVLAKKAQCTMVPVTHNSGRFWLNDQFAKRAGVIDLYIHKPVETDKHSAEELMAIVEETVVRQLAEIEQQYEINEEGKQATA